MSGWVTGHFVRKLSFESTHSRPTALPGHKVVGKKEENAKTDVTPAILLRNFVVQPYRATILQYAIVHVAHCNFVA